MGLLVPNLLTPEHTQKLVSEKARWILSCCTPSALVVFGSAARGEMTEASDVDLALIFSDQPGLEEARKNLYRAPPVGELWPQDLVFYTEKDFLHRLTLGGLVELIRKEGRLLAGRWP